MPTVPQQTGPSVQERALPDARLQPAAAGNAFTGGLASENVNKAAQGAVREANDWYLEAKKKADQVAHVAADSQAAELQATTQIAVSKMKGVNAAGAPDMAAKAWDDGVAKIGKTLANDDQKRAFFASSAARWTQLNQHTQLHVASEAEKTDDETTQGYLNNSKNAAALNSGDSTAVQMELNRQRAVMSDWASRKGIRYDSPAYKSAMTQQLSATHTAVINSKLDNSDVKGAQMYLDAHKAEMTADQMNQATKNLEAQTAVQRGLEAWGVVGKYKLSDGTPDLARMEKEVMADPDHSDPEKLKIYDFVKARAAEDLANKNHADAARDRSFMNTAMKARTDGQPLEEALKIVKRYGGDTYQQAIMTDSIKKIYAPPEKSNQAVKYDLWQGVQDGKVAPAAIDAAQLRGDLSGPDATSLKEQRYKIEIEGSSPEMKSARERVKELAKTTFGGNQDKSRAFELEVNEAARGKSPDEYWKIANDKLKVDPTTRNHFLWIEALPFGGDQQYVTDRARRDAQATAFGQANSDLGADTVKAIGQGVAVKGGKTFSPRDIEAFASAFGGYDKIQPGTPVNNAIQSLRKRNKPVVPENINAVLQKYPDGNY